MEGPEILERVRFVVQVGGALGQDPYRSDLFNLCREAYRGGHTNQGARPLLTGDAMIDALRERLRVDSSEHQMTERLRHLGIVWSAWLYAFRRLEE